MPNFLSYGLAEAKKTNFDVQTLGGLKQYLAGYLQHRETRAATQAAQATRAARDREEAAQIAYDQYRRQTAERIFAALPSTEQAVIEDMASGKPRPFGRAEG